MIREEASERGLGGAPAPSPAPAEPQRPGSPESSSPSRRSPSTASGQLNLAAMQDADSAATCAILLPERYTIKEGSELWGGVKLGRLLGAGVQAKVFELVFADGQPTGKVLKIAHTDLGHKLLNNPIMWIGMEREWEIGTQLRAALEEQGGSLPGFMRMCDCLVRSDDPASGRARFNGMIMEKLNGWEVYKRIDTPEFHNIHYVREMLFQVFSALDRAQRKLGFHHADLGMRNVMEHYPRLWAELEKPAAAAGAAGAAGGTAGGTPGAAGAAAAGGQSLGPGDRCFTCQKPQQRCPAEAEEHYAAVQRSGGSMPRAEHQPWWRRSGGSCSRVRPKPGFSCNADGSRLPLGPNVEFKVIDYGVAVFDKQLAQAAGGYESEEVMARLNEIFAARKITFGSKSKKMSLEMETSEGVVPGGPRRTWHLLPTGIRNRFRVKQTPVGATPIPTQQSLEADALQDAAIIRAAAAAAAAEAGAGPGSGGAGGANGSGAADDQPLRFRSATLLRRPGEGLAKAAELMRASQAVSQDGSGVQPNPQRGTSKMPQYKQSPIERVYRRFWQHKGDVFHLMLGMAIVLDDRVWPKEDERDVQLFISLVHHVTGVRMKASFAEEGQPGSSGFFGRLACGGMPSVKHGEDTKPSLRDYGRWGKWHHFFRRMHIRFQAHWSPYNSGLLAGEALVAPFFGAGRVQHAKLPVCVEQAFPRSAA
ncbi:kinase-like superfamily [Chlorella sorokiniana]|uniref:Kinase-like superfamily n=1 Tax=Chlorella sorokiniana TaxID=3076 RepID=A0A2P6TKX4_CHLSO|nr:kinase-like superfamily [Chlorella sorokiniana]|eukprot:PRW44896.1 kinase-like superfamily [Chlorella sorokiniana]